MGEKGTSLPFPFPLPSGRPDSLVNFFSFLVGDGGTCLSLRPSAKKDCILSQANFFPYCLAQSLSTQRIIYLGT